MRAWSKTTNFDHKQATHAFLRALDLDNISAGAVEGLERLFSADAIANDDVAAVAGRLAPYYELTENYAKWAGTLESLVRVAASDAERRAHLDMLADLYAGPLGDAVAAYGAVQRIFEIEPSSQSVRERLVQLGELVGKLPEISASTRRVLAATDVPTLRQALLMLLADVEERQSGRLAEAEAALRGVLEIDPLHLGAYRALCRICKDAERWAALRDLIAEREKHLPDVRQRVELLWQIIEIDEGLLFDRPDATSTLRRIIEADKADLKAYRILNATTAKQRNGTTSTIFCRPRRPWSRATILPISKSVGQSWRWRALAMHLRRCSSSPRCSTWRRRMRKPCRFSNALSA